MVLLCVTTNSERDSGVTTSRLLAQRFLCRVRPLVTRATKNRQNKHSCSEQVDIHYEDADAGRGLSIKLSRLIQPWRARWVIAT